MLDNYPMEITALIHDCAAESEPGFAATCVEFPEANGQGETVEACLENLRGAIRDMLAYRKEQAVKSLLAGERLEVVSA
jgi:predicted RNase H-like HicB family nuclease